MPEGLTQDALLKAVAGMHAEAAEEALPVTVPEAINNEPTGNLPAGDDRETVWAAFDVLDPDCAYETWLSVLMGAHSVDSSESMMAKADAWSSGGTKYKPGEVAAKWRSFETGGGTTVATIAHLADQTGRAWRPKRPIQPSTTRSGHRVSSSTTESPNLSDTLILTRMSDVEEQQITWLWLNRFARGKFNQLQGDPGLGKTMVVCDITSRVTVGADWPDGSPNDGSGSVIIITSEDDPADTLKPRLRRAGADMTKIHVLETAMVFDPKSGKLVREPFDIGQHVPLLMKAIEQIGDVVLVIMDPISAYTGKVDSHKAAEVRGMLVEFLQMIAQKNICLLGIIHQNKQIGGKSVYRASGSLAFTAAARAVWMIAQDHEDEKRRLMLPVKCNIAARLNGMAYRIESDGFGPPFVHWEADPVQLSADGYLKQEENSERKNDQASALEKATEFIREQLKDGPMLSKDLESAVRANYIAPATYKRARESLNCRAAKDGKIWWTLLPGQKSPNEESQSTLPDIHDALDTLEPLDTHK